MKILLVNNHTKHMGALTKALAGHELEVVEYHPGIKFNEQNKDLIVLSGGGGEGLEITDKFNRHKLWYEDEMQLVRTTDKPVLGICMGFEVIVRAYGGKVNYRPQLTYGYKTSHTTLKGERLFKQKAINQVEAHYWHVPEVSEKQFDILAESDSGIEIIKHKEKRILGTQFHPESDGTLSVAQLLTQLA